MKKINAFIVIEDDYFNEKLVSDFQENQFIESIFILGRNIKNNNTGKLFFIDCFEKNILKQIQELTDKGNEDILIISSNYLIRSTDIDNLLNILYLHEKNAFVIPENNFGVFSGNNKFLNGKVYYGDYRLIPYIDIPCVIIKNSIIRNFSNEFDTGLSLINNLVKYSLHVNKYGYSTLVSLHTNCLYSGDTEKTGRYTDIEKDPFIDDIFKEFFPRKTKLNFNMLVIVKKIIIFFLNIIDIIKSYISFKFESSHFIKDKKIKLLFFMISLPDCHNGTSEYGLNILKGFINGFSDKYEITVLANESGAKFHRLEDYDCKLLFMDSFKGRYDIAFIPNQIHNIEWIKILNRKCSKIVFCMFDIIMIRCIYLYRSVALQAFENAIHYCDGFITISDFTKKDTQNFFNKKELWEFNPVIESILLGVDSNNKILKKNMDRYILIVGNEYAHKSIDMALEEVKSIKGFKFIVIGKEKNNEQYNNITFYGSGYLDKEMIEELYMNCYALLYPSQYEGFGFPLLHAAKYNKEIIMFNNEINNEVIKHCIYDYNINNIYFFDFFKQIPEIILQLRGNELKEVKTRSWGSVIAETEKYFDLMNKNYSLKRKIYRSLNL